MLAHMEIVQSTIFGNASTAISILAGAILLGEPLTIHHIVCALLILAGVIGLALAPAPAENSGKKLGVSCFNDHSIDKLTLYNKVTLWEKEIYRRRFVWNL